MPAAGLLLTGGASRRMGRDKATLPLSAALGRDAPGERLAVRTGRLLATAVTPAPALEVGPGHSDLAVAPEPDPGRGPLTAVAAGAAALDHLGWRGPAIVVATDLPLLSVEFLGWLSEHPSPRSVVPVAAGRPQPLCARWSAADLTTACALAAAGERSMRALLGATAALLVAEDAWAAPAGGPDALVDVDRPDDLEVLRRRTTAP